MEADFSGYASKAGIRCSDGRTIMPGAFKGQDKAKVPLVWQHGHKDVKNVLGHVYLENRKDGVYAYGFFNKTEQAAHARELLEHDDVNQMSIWANQLVEKAKQVFHGVIREVSLVLAGANSEARIENVSIRHSEDPEDIEVLDDEIIVWSGLALQHGGKVDVTDDVSDDEDDNDEEDDKLQHADGGPTVQDVYDAMTEEQQAVVNFLVGQALEGVGHDALDEDADNQTIYDSFSDIQKELVETLIHDALGSSDEDEDDDPEGQNQKGKKMKTGTVRHNAFEQEGDEGSSEYVLSHDDLMGLFESAKAGSGSSLKAVFEAHLESLQHNITDIDILFPEAVAVSNTPEFESRRMEWVASFLGKVKKSPFSRIKTFRADITVEEARAKGYVKGALKKEEFFQVSRRITTPTTIYKKQALDRDDVVDITDFDVVTWLKGEMRLMLDEEIARAALLGDGRSVDHEDKINEQNIRPIASDHEFFVTTVNVNIDDASSSVDEITDAVIKNRRYYKGSGKPTFYTTEEVIALFLLKRDAMLRRMYRDLGEVAAELRCDDVVSVEAMEEDTTLLGVIVNPVDYTLGATRGGEVSLFEDFDIDYNKQKYLIETRCSGALTKLKAALVVRRMDSGDILVVPAAPTYDEEEGEVTIHDTTHVTYKNADTDATLTNGASPYTVAPGATLNITAVAADGYYFESSAVDDWSFTNES